MGACGSKVEEAKVDEQQEMFAWAVKEMQLVCAIKFFSSEQSINIELPKDQTERISAEADEVDKVAEKKEGGMLAKVQGVLKQGAEQVKQGLKQVKEGIEKNLQDRKNAAIGKVQVKLLNDSNSEILHEKFVEEIKKGTAQDARNLVRGESPYGEDQYKNCKSDAIVDDLYKQNKDSLKAILIEHCDFDANASVKAWSQLLDGIGKANDVLGRNKFNINFDIKDYIADKTLLHIMKTMGEYEKEVRSDPNVKANDHKETFELCFSGKPVNNVDFQKFKRGF